MPPKPQSDRLSVPLTPEEAAALATLAARLGTTPEDVAHAALVLYLAAHTGDLRNYGSPALVTVVSYVV